MKRNTQETIPATAMSRRRNPTKKVAIREKAKETLQENIESTIRKKATN